MPDIPDTVPFAQAQNCPECGHPGKIEHSNAIVGGTLHKLTCLNKVCPWYGTGWMVETDANGEVRVNKEAMARAQGQRLIAPKDPQFDEIYEAVHKSLDRQVAEETGSAS